MLAVQKRCGGSVDIKKRGGYFRFPQRVNTINISSPPTKVEFRKILAVFFNNKRPVVLSDQVNTFAQVFELAAFRWIAVICFLRLPFHENLLWHLLHRCLWGGLQWCAFGDSLSVEIFFGKIHTHEASLWGGLPWCGFWDCLYLKIGNCRADAPQRIAIKNTPPRNG